METKGYRIEEFERALPAGAVIDEVRYGAHGGLMVKSVIGYIKIRSPFTRTILVTWDNEGLCRRRRNGERIPEWDVKLEGGK